MTWGEVHVFQGRMFVTLGRGTTGVHVPDERSDAELGEAIIGLSARPTTQRDDGGASWRAFCADVVGVPDRGYRPEKSARVFLRDGAWRVAADYFGAEAPTPAEPAADLPQRLGALVRRELGAVAPRWPTVREVMILTTATGRLVVMPVVDGYLIGPARSVDVDAGALLPAVRAALPESVRPDVKDLPYFDWMDEAAASYREALAAEGIDPHLLRGGARVSLEELSDGSVRLTGTGGAGNRPVAEQTWLGRAGDLAAACDQAVRMIGELPVEHLPPGTPAGASFGIKDRWLAVRGSTVEEVAAAIGLTDGREAGWDEGVASRRDRVFVAPPVAGWILVVLTGYRPGVELLADLSTRLGTEVQFFGNPRVASYAEWARAVDGRLVRHVRCSEDSEDPEQVGEPTPVEIEIGFSATDPSTGWAEQDDVMRVAAAWSIDPTSLDVR